MAAKPIKSLELHYTMTQFLIKEYTPKKTAADLLISKPQSRCSWGQNRFIYQAADDWNILSDEVKSTSDILTFKIHIRSIS